MTPQKLLWHTQVLSWAGGVFLICHEWFWVVHLNQGSSNIFVRGLHKLLRNSSRAGHLAWCNYFGIGCILRNQVFRKYLIFSLLTKRLRGSNEVASRAGFDPRAKVWRPLTWSEPCVGCKFWSVLLFHLKQEFKWSESI